MASKKKALFSGSISSEMCQKMLKRQKLELIKMGWSAEEAEAFIQKCGPAGNNLLEDAYMQLMKANASGSGYSRMHASAIKQMERHDGSNSHHHPLVNLQQNLLEVCMDGDDISQKARLQAMKNVLGIVDASEKPYEMKEHEAENYMKLACNKARYAYENEKKKSSKVGQDKRVALSDIKSVEVNPFQEVISEKQNALFDAASDLFEAWLSSHEEVFSEKQLQVVEGSLRGLTQKEIAAQGGFNQQMVSKHLKAACKKADKQMKPIDMEMDLYKKREVIQKAEKQIDYLDEMLLRKEEEAWEEQMADDLAVMLEPVF